MSPDKDAESLEVPAVPDARLEGEVGGGASGGGGGAGLDLDSAIDDGVAELQLDELEEVDVELAEEDDVAGGDVSAPASLPPGSMAPSLPLPTLVAPALLGARPPRAPSLPAVAVAAPVVVYETSAELLAALLQESPRQRMEVLVRELSFEGEPGRRAVLEHEIGRLFERDEHDEARATEAWARALEADPGLKPNLWALRRAYERRGDYRSLAGLVSVEEMAAGSEKERAELLVEKGHLLEDRLEDEAAAEEAYRSALNEEPNSLLALMALERRALRAGDREAHAGLLRELVAATDEPGRKTELLIELAHVESELGVGDPRGPFERLRQALAVGVAPARVLDEIERLALSQGDAGELLALLDRRAALAEAGEGAEALERLVEVRRYQAQLRAGEPEQARAYLESALVRAPDEPLLLLDLSEMAEAEGRHAEAAELLGRLQEYVGPKVAMRVGLARARALRSAGRELEAVEAERSLGDEAHLRVLRGGEQQEYASAIGDPELLAAALHEEGEIARAAGESRWAARAFDACAALRERIGDHEGALQAWWEALAALPDDAIALDALDVTLARRGMHAERARVLEQKLSGADAEETAGLLEQLVELRADHLDDPDGAIAAAEALCALRGGPAGDDVAARFRLVEITRHAGRFAEAADQLSRLAAALARQGTAAEAAEAQLARAELLEHRLRDEAGALAAIEAALLAAPAESAARAAAESEQRRLLAQTGQWERVAQLLREEAAREKEPARVARLLIELAQVLSRRLGRAEAAAAAWHELAERVPDERVARRALGRAMSQDADPRQVARWLEAGLEGAQPTEQAARLVRVGELYEDRVGDPAVALAAYTRALVAGGDAAPHAALGLWRAHARLGDATGLDEAIAGLARFADAETAAALIEERARLAERAGDLDAARARLDEVRLLDPRSLSALLAQQRLAARAGQPAELAQALSGLADATTDGELANTLHARAAVLGFAAGRAAVAEAPAIRGPEADVLALLRGDRLSSEPAADAAGEVERIEALLAHGRLGQAAAALQPKLEAAPTDLVLLELARRIARAGGDRLSQARATHGMAMAVSDPEQAAALLGQAAEQLEELDAHSEAALAWRSLATLRPEDSEPFLRAAALLGRLGDEGALEQLLGEKLPRVTGDAERAALLVERGLLFARTGRGRLGAADLETALATSPDDPRALEALAELRAESGDRTGAAFLLERRIAPPEGEVDLATPRDQANLPLLLRLLDIYQGLGNLDGLRRTLRRLVPLDPESAELRERAAELLERYGDPAGALVHLRFRAQLGGDPLARARAEVRAAVIQRDALGDLAAARAALARALALQPLQLDALAALMPLCVNADDVLVRDAALKRAARAAQSAIDEDPADPLPYAALERVLDWQADDDGRQLAMQAAAAVAGRPIPPRRGGLEPQRELPAEQFERAFSPEARGVALAIWREAHEAAQRVLGVDGASLGMGRNTRQNERGAPLAWQPVDRIARAVGATGYALHAVAGAADTCAVVGDALLLGNAYADSPGPDERFQVARRLVLLRDRLGPIENADADSLALFFAACARVAEARWSGAAQLPEGRIEEWTRQITRTLDRKARKALQALAPRFAELGSPATWRSAVMAGANRIALAVTGDLAVALSELALDPLSPDARTAIDARALVRFSVSDELGAMRRALGQRS